LKKPNAGIVCEDGIPRHENSGAEHSLRDDEPIEWIAMNQRQRAYVFRFRYWATAYCVRFGRQFPHPQFHAAPLPGIGG
jgi:hypothetical protein